MKNITYLLTILFLVESCSNNEDKNLQIEIETLVSDNLKIQEGRAKDYFNSMELLLAKTETKEKAIYWLQKALKADTIYKTLTSSLELNNEVTKETLIELMFKYERDLKNIDSNVANNFNEVITHQQLLRDSVTNHNYLVRHLNTKKICTEIELFKNRAINYRNNFIAYCHKNIPNYFLCGYETFNAIISQNSTYFKINEVLEITSGIGKIERKSEPQIFINKQEYKVNNEGVSTAKINVGNTKGKHKKQVTISFVKPDGKKDSVTKEIVYYVE